MYNNPKWVFISRFLKDNSTFKQVLLAEGWQVYGESLLDFQAVSFEKLPIANWIFFYSKKGVRFFFEQLQSMEAELENVQFASIGEGTARVMQRFGIQPDFVGTGEPASTAQAFSRLAQGQHVIFPQAAQSRQSIQTHLQEQITAYNLIVYQNSMRTDFQLPEFDILVFTSPMNAQAYFAKKRWQAQQKVVAIGQTTARTLTQLGITEVQIAEQPDEQHLAEAVLEVGFCRS